jgi:hypothetical protein
MKIPSLKDLLKGVPPDDEHLSIIIGLGDIEKSHEAAAIISTSLLELSLKKAIITAFRLKMTDEDLAKVFDFNTTGPLSTFSSKKRDGSALSGPKCDLVDPRRVHRKTEIYPRCRAISLGP